MQHVYNTALRASHVAMMCCPKRRQIGPLNAGSIAKVVHKVQALLATQEQEPVLIGCGLTLVQAEAILDKTAGSGSCVRFHLLSSGYWDCYFYRDPLIEHEATLTGLITAWTKGLIGETLDLKSFALICPIFASL